MRVGLLTCCAAVAWGDPSRQVGVGPTGNLWHMNAAGSVTHFPRGIMQKPTPKVADHTALEDGGGAQRDSPPGRHRRLAGTSAQCPTSDGVDAGSGRKELYDNFGVDAIQVLFCV